MIYKGCAKRMIVLKNPQGEYFEEAYFILKENQQHRQCASEDSMIKEANRIIAKYGVCSPQNAKKKPIPLICFLIGMLSGIGFLMLLNLFIL